MFKNKVEDTGADHAHPITPDNYNSNDPLKNQRVIVEKVSPRSGHETPAALYSFVDHTTPSN